LVTRIYTSFACKCTSDTQSCSTVDDPKLPEPLLGHTIIENTIPS